ncbi:unnamed protein product [Closterium sp. NIES-65]|nr:unnamed protein product [Closterium sp. NIES-65]
MGAVSDQHISKHRSSQRQKRRVMPSLRLALLVLGVVSAAYACLVRPHCAPATLPLSKEVRASALHLLPPLPHLPPPFCSHAVPHELELRQWTGASRIPPIRPFPFPTPSHLLPPPPQFVTIRLYLPPCAPAATAAADDARRGGKASPCPSPLPHIPTPKFEVSAHTSPHARPQELELLQMMRAGGAGAAADDAHGWGRNGEGGDGGRRRATAGVKRLSAGVSGRGCSLLPFPFPKSLAFFRPHALPLLPLSAPSPQSEAPPPESNGYLQVFLDGGLNQLCTFDAPLNAPLPESNGYLQVFLDGGLNQQRISVCNAVAVARQLDASQTALTSLSSSSPPPSPPPPLSPSPHQVCNAVAVARQLDASQTALTSLSSSSPPPSPPPPLSPSPHQVCNAVAVVRQLDASQTALTSLSSSSPPPSPPPPLSPSPHQVCNAVAVARQLDASQTALTSLSSSSPPPSPPPPLSPSPHQVCNAVAVARQLDASQTALTSLSSSSPPPSPPPPLSPSPHQVCNAVAVARQLDASQTALTSLSSSSPPPSPPPPLSPSPHQVCNAVAVARQLDASQTALTSLSSSSPPPSPPPPLSPSPHQVCNAVAVARQLDASQTAFTSLSSSSPPPSPPPPLSPSPHQVCNAVAVARLLNATLLVPEFATNIFWQDSRWAAHRAAGGRHTRRQVGGTQRAGGRYKELQRLSSLLQSLLIKPTVPFPGPMYTPPSHHQFADIFDLDHFISSLRADIRIERRLPRHLAWSTAAYYASSPSRRNKLIRSAPLHATKKWYLKRVLPRLKQRGIVALTPFSHRLAFTGLPREIQRLRCRVNFHALRFVQPIRELGQKLVQRLQDPSLRPTRRVLPHSPSDSTSAAVLEDGGGERGGREEGGGDWDEGAEESWGVGQSLSADTSAADVVGRGRKGGGSEERGVREEGGGNEDGGGGEEGGGEREEGRRIRVELVGDGGEGEDSGGEGREGGMGGERRVGRSEGEKGEEEGEEGVEELRGERVGEEVGERGNGEGLEELLWWEARAKKSEHGGQRDGNDDGSEDGRDKGLEHGEERGVRDDGSEEGGEGRKERGGNEEEGREGKKALHGREGVGRDSRRRWERELEGGEGEEGNGRSAYRGSDFSWDYEGREDAWGSGAERESAGIERVRSGDGASERGLLGGYRRRRLLERVVWADVGGSGKARGSDVGGDEAEGDDVWGSEVRGGVSWVGGQGEGLVLEGPRTEGGEKMGEEGGKGGALWWEAVRARVREVRELWLRIEHRVRARLEQWAEGMRLARIGAMWGEWKHMQRLRDEGAEGREGMEGREEREGREGRDGRGWRDEGKEAVQEERHGALWMVKGVRRVIGAARGLWWRKGRDAGLKGRKVGTQEAVEGGQRRRRFLAMHLRFDLDMVAHSRCDYGEAREEREQLRRYWKRAWGELEGKVQHTPQQLRAAGKCPLTPEEAGLVLAALGFSRHTRLYVASYKVYGNPSRMAALRRLFPNLEDKTTLATPEELRPFRGRASMLAALDFYVSTHSDVFVSTSAGNMHNVMAGYRTYFGGRKTIKLNTPLLASLLQTPNLTWPDFTRAVRTGHEGRLGQIKARRADQSLYTYPAPECLCRVDGEAGREVEARRGGLWRWWWYGEQNQKQVKVQVQEPQPPW